MGGSCESFIRQNNIAAELQLNQSGNVIYELETLVCCRGHKNKNGHGITWSFGVFVSNGVIKGIGVLLGVFKLSFSL